MPYDNLHVCGDSSAFGLKKVYLTWPKRPLNQVGYGVLYKFKRKCCFSPTHCTADFNSLFCHRFGITGTLNGIDTRMVM